jgi:hypothetical protein
MRADRSDAYDSVGPAKCRTHARKRQRATT